MLRLFLLATFATEAVHAFIGPSKIGIWHELLSVDCRGGVHLLNKNPLEMNINLVEVKKHLDFFAAQVEARAKIHCPLITESEIERRMPTFGMLLNRAHGVGGDDTVCVDSDGKPVFARTLFNADLLSATLLNGGIMGANALKSTGHASSFYAMGLETPETCTYESWKQGGACAFQLSHDLATSDYTIGVSMKKCPDSHIWPYISLTCSGPACSSIGTFCDDESDCGGANVECKQDLFDNLPYKAFGATKEDVMKLLKYSQVRLLFLFTHHRSSQCALRLCVHVVHARYSHYIEVLAEFPFPKPPSLPPSLPLGHYDASSSTTRTMRTASVASSTAVSFAAGSSSSCSFSARWDNVAPRPPTPKSVCACRKLMSSLISC